MFKYKLIEGKNPRTEAPIFYAMPASINPITLNQVAAEISGECTVTPHDIRAVISALEQHIVSHLQNGDSVRLGLIGSFCPTIRSKSTSTPEAFTSTNIEGLGVRFTQSATMAYKLSVDNPGVVFQRVDEKD